MDDPKFCQICQWWNPCVFDEFVGPYPIHYLPLLLKRKNFEVEILAKPYPIPQELAEIIRRKKLAAECPEREQEIYEGIRIKKILRREMVLPNQATSAPSPK